MKPLQRLSGSGGFGNAARSVLLLDRDPDDPDGENGNRRVLAHIKCNVGRLMASLLYEIRPILLPAVDGMPELETSRLELVGESHHDGRALLDAGGEDERSAREEAEEFLRDLLADGACHPAAGIYAEASKHRISNMTLKRARVRIGAKTRKAGFGGGWEWWLPHKETTQENIPIGAEPLVPSPGLVSSPDPPGNSHTSAKGPAQLAFLHQGTRPDSPYEPDTFVEQDEIERLARLCLQAQNGA
jgi:hypothetical protein